MKRRVKEGGHLALQPMGRDRMAASVPDFPSSLANAGRMPAPLEAGASRMSSSRSSKMSIRIKAKPRAASGRSIHEMIDRRDGPPWNVTLFPIGFEQVRFPFLLELVRVKRVIVALSGKQLLMRSAFDDPAIFDHENPIRRPDGG